MHAGECDDNRGSTSGHSAGGWRDVQDFYGGSNERNAKFHFSCKLHCDRDERG